MNDALRWGILGTGRIARKFAAQLPQTATARFTAVGSRWKQSAGRFAQQFGGSARGSYQSLLADEAVDAVYIALPNALHREWTIRALEAGKHVLCEKPVASSRAEAEAMFDTARRTGRVLIEAFMYRCHPAVEKLIATVRDGAIGRVKLIRSHFTFNRPDALDDVRFQPSLAGGSLMDVGCYPINLARALAGSEPTSMHAVAHRHPSGVDDYAAGCLDFGGDTLAVFTCGMTVEADRTTLVGGSEGYLEIDAPWFSDGTFTLVTNQGEQRETIRVTAAMDLYALEAEAFAATVQDGVDPWIPESDTLGNMRVLDALRHQVGVPF